MREGRRAKNHNHTSSPSASVGATEREWLAAAVVTFQSNYKYCGGRSTQQELPQIPQTLAQGHLPRYFINIQASGNMCLDNIVVYSCRYNMTFETKCIYIILFCGLCLNWVRMIIIIIIIINRLFIMLLYVCMYIFIFIFFIFSPVIAFKRM